MRIKKDDIICVTAGNFKNRQGRVKSILHDKSRVIIAGVNLRKKHVKPSQDNPQGGRIDIEAPIAISSILPYCGQCEKPVRVKIQTLEDGKKVRLCIKCNSEYGEKY